MYKKHILNLILFLVVISLASIIYLSDEKSTLLEQLSDINVDSITTIKIQHNQNTSTIIKSSNAHWNITAPVAVAANDFRINSILKLINAPVHNQYSLPEINTDNIGLESPLTTIQFNNHTFEFGITNPATNLRYIKYNNTVYTIEDVYFPLISSHFSTLVSLNLLPVNSNINKLILLNQTISRDDKGLWHSNLELSADNIVKTIQHWQQDQAFAVHRYLQRKELGEVFIYVANSPQPIRYQITDVDPWLVIARPEIGLEYHLDIEAYDKLITPTDSNDDIELNNNQ